MKSRKSFVTNSSSSSFIVTTKDNVKTIPASISLNFDLMECVHSTFTDIKDFKSEFEDQYGIPEDWGSYEYGLFDKAMSALRDGGVVHMGSVGNDYSEPIEQLLYDCGMNDVQIEFGELVHYDN